MSQHPMMKGRTSYRIPVQALAAFAIVIAILAARQSTQADQTPSWAPGTFSILGFDPATGEVGGAVQSRVFSVGSRNIWADASAGAAVTQATGDTSYGPQ